MVQVDAEVALFRAICRYKPVGIHKHFRMYNLVKFLNQSSETQFSYESIQTELEKYYDLKGLEDEDEIWEEEFELPWQDYGELIEEFGKAEVASETSPEATPSPEPEEKRRGRRKTVSPKSNKKKIPPKRKKK